MELKDNKYFLIDLDGVILDTAYDNFFWQEYIPKVYAKKNNIALSDAINFTHALFHYKKKTKDWYDITYWSNILDIDIAKEKEKEMNMNKICLKDGSLDVLDKLKDQEKKLFLITNAHRITLNIKLRKFNISKYFDEMICSHELGYIKEDIQFWHVLRLKLKLDYKSSILIEDTFDNIDSAHHAGLNNFVYISDDKKFTSPLSPLIVESFSELSSSI